MLVVMPLLTSAIGFVLLYVTYLVTRSVAPGLLGEVADRPASFAALTVLVALPMHAVLMVVFAWKPIRATLAGADVPDAPVRSARRRFGDHLITQLPDVVAALIVVTAVIDAPSAALLAVTILGPVALSWSMRAVNALRRWGWRRWTGRGHRPRHMAAGNPH
jgi:hypothetical protein